MDRPRGDDSKLEAYFLPGLAGIKPAPKSLIEFRYRDKANKRID
jgi:hypothetical protein